MKSRDRGVEDADGTFAEFEVFERGTSILLYAKMSKRAIQADACATYRCEEDQSPLEISKVLDVFVADACRDFFNERVELLKSLLAEDRLDDVLMDLLASVLAQTFLLLCCRGDPGQ